MVKLTYMILHFGGSPTGIHVNLTDYHDIRTIILGMGHTVARDWLGKEKETGILNIFSENERSISRSDGVILDATYDSHSIGIQLAIALMYKRPVLLLIKQGAENPITNPRIVNAKDMKLIQTVNYHDVSDIEPILSNFIGWIESNGQMARFNIELDRKLDNYLRIKSRINHSSKAEEIRRLVEADLINPDTAIGEAND